MEIYEKLEKAFGNRNDRDVLNKLYWLLDRCVMESKPIRDEKEEISYDNGIKLLNEFLCGFLRDFLNEFSEEEEKKTLAKDTKDKIKNEIISGGGSNIEDGFYKFLSEKEREKGGIDDPWNNAEWAQDFIKLLASYRRPMDSNIYKQLANFVSDINNESLRYVYELIQNADDCEYRDEVEKKVKLTFLDNGLEISYPEKGMTYSDIIAITTVGQSNKVSQKKKKIIGEKGMGFKTLFSVCDSVDIHSNYYHFRLTGSGFAPEWIGDTGDRGKVQEESAQGTKMLLHFHSNANHELKKALEETYYSLIKKYGIKMDGNVFKPEAQSIFQNCPVMFTNKIDTICIDKRDSMVDEQGGNKRDGQNCLTIHREISESGDEMRITYSRGDSVEETLFSLKCLRVAKEVAFTYDEYRSRYPEIFKDEEEFGEDKSVTTYPVIMLAPLDFSMVQGRSVLHDNEIKEGNLFSYLPTTTYINAPLTIQIPFELNKNRSGMWIQKNENSDRPDIKVNQTTAWNHRLFHEVFISNGDNKSLLEMMFEALKEKIQTGEMQKKLYRYIPQYKQGNHNFFKGNNDENNEVSRQMNDFCKENGEDRIFKAFKEIKMFRKLLPLSGYLSINDGLIMFDGFASEIITSEIKKNPQDMKELDFIIGIEHCTEKIIDSIVLGENLKALGLKQREMESDEKQLSFANWLIRKNRQAALENLLQEQGKVSAYFTGKGSEYERLEIIRIKGREDRYFSYESHKIWVEVQDSESVPGCRYLVDGNDNNIAVYYENENTEPAEGGIRKAVKDIYMKGREKEYFFPIETLSEKESSPLWKKIISTNSPTDRRMAIGITMLLSWFEKNSSADCKDDWFENARELTGRDGSGAKDKEAHKVSKKNIEAFREMWSSVPVIDDGNEGRIKEGSDDEKIIRLQILWAEKGKRKYELPPADSWTETICEEINRMPYDNTWLKLKKEPIESEADKSLLGDAESYVDKFYIIDQLAADYVRFSKTVLFQKKTDENDYKKVKDKFIQSIGLAEISELLKDVAPIKDYPRDKLEKLTHICQLQNLYNIDNQGSGRAEKDNNAWHELLQNANDHIKGSAELKIEFGSDQLRLTYPEAGFSIRDFVAICTSGNSGNLECSENREGNKGTGFKSVYRYFEKVVIKCNAVQCTLSDQGENKHYPAPKFEEITISDRTDQKTTVTVISCEFKNKGYSEKFEEMIHAEDFIFLDNIKSISTEGIDLSKIITSTKEEYLKKFFYPACPEEMEIDEEIIEWRKAADQNKEIPKRWETIDLQEEKWKGKKSIKILFPREDMIGCPERSRPVYCTLPISSFQLKVPFYVNIPLLELKDDRQEISKNFKEWNQKVLDLALYGEESAFTRIMRGFCKEKAGDIHLKNVYKYMPFCEKELFKKAVCTIPFIRTIKTTTGNKCQEEGEENDFQVEGYALEKRKEFGILPQYMYIWFQKKGGLDGFKSETPFVYYGNCNEWEKSAEKCIKDILEQQQYAISNETEKFYDEIKEYISNYKSRHEGQDFGEFDTWLREIFESLQNDDGAGRISKENFREMREIIFFSYLCGKIEGEKFHCIGNNKFNKQNESGVKIEGYTDISCYADIIRRVFYNENYKFQQEEIDAIENCFGKVVISPYIIRMKNDEKATFDLKTKEEDLQELQKIVSELENQKELLYGETILYLKMINGLRGNDVCEHKDAILRILRRQTAEENKEDEYVLVGKNGVGEYVFLDKECIVDDWKKVSIDHEKVIKLYEGSETVNGDSIQLANGVLIQLFLGLEKFWKAFRNEKPENVKSGLQQEIAVKILKGLIRQGNGETLSWYEKFGELIRDFAQDDFPKKQSVFLFDGKEQLVKLPSDILDVFDQKVSSDSKRQEIKLPSKSETKLEEFVGNNVFILECNTNGKLLYCWGKKNDQDIIVLFGKKAFGKMLREEFDCAEYSENKRYEPMICYESDSFFPVSQTIEESEKVKLEESAGKILKKAEGSEDYKEYLKNALIERWDVRTNIKFIHASGYGAVEFEEKRCPICGSVLIAERAVLKLGYVTCRKGGDNVFLPMLMCDNCYKSMNYAEEVLFPYVKEDDLYLTKPDKQEISLIFKMFANETKEMKVQISFLNRWLWYIKLK